MAVDTENLIKQYLENNKPSDALGYAQTFAYCRVMFEATQKVYSEIVGISDRALRKYISDNREAYDAEVQRLDGEKESELDLGSASLTARALSEEQLDAFVSNIFKRATAKDASVREWEFLLSFTGLQAQDVINLNEAKSKSLRWWIKGELPSLKRYLNTKTLGLMTETSEIVYRGNKDSAKNAQTFVNAELTDEAFKRELMYWGAVHLSLMNNVEYPDLDILATAVRLDRIEQGTKETYSLSDVKKYASGQAMRENTASASEDKMLEMLVEAFGAEEAQAIVSARKAVQAPESDKADIQQRASQYQDELRVLLTAEENIRFMMTNPNTKGIK